MIKARVTIDYKNLNLLKGNLQKNISKKATRAGVKPLITAVKSAAPFQSGALKKSIGSKVDARKGSVVAYGIVGPKSKYQVIWKGKVRKPSRYAHLQNKAQFLKTAWNASKDSCISIMQEVFAREINAALSKQGN